MNHDADVIWSSVDGTEVISGVALTEAITTGAAFVLEENANRITVLWDYGTSGRLVTYRREPEPTDCPDCGTAKVRRYADGSCATCWFWNSQFAIPGGLIINGNHYRISDEPSPEELAADPKRYGNYGKRFVIRLADGTEVVTHNLWNQGAIPPALSRPDNATFIRDNDNEAGAR